MTEMAGQIRIGTAEVLPCLKYDERGLIPAIVQDVKSGTVLMLAYMNQESLEKTLQDGRTWFFSRSRQELWAKGESSGHVQKVQAIYYDCDADTLLVQVDQTGVACHEGSFSCFSRALLEREEAVSEDWAVFPGWRLVLGREDTSKPGRLLHHLPV